jgi:hypothetical protein
MEDLGVTHVYQQQTDKPMARKISWGNESLTDEQNCLCGRRILSDFTYS